MEDIDIRSLGSISEVYAAVSEFLLEVIINLSRKYNISVEERSEVLDLACEKVLRSRHTFKPGVNIGGWLYTVALTTILDYLDKRNRRLGKYNVFPPEEYEAWRKKSSEEYDDTYDADEEAASRESEERMGRISARALEVLGTFSQQDQEIFFRTMEGEKSADIADALGMTAVNVRQRLMKIKAKLKKLLTDEFGALRKEVVLYNLPDDVMSGMMYRRSDAQAPEFKVDYGADLLDELQTYLRCCYDFAVVKTQENMSGDILKQCLKEEFGRVLPVKVRSYNYSDGREIVKMSVGLKEGNAVLDVSNAEMDSLISFVGHIDSYIEDAETLFDDGLRKSLFKMCM